MQISPLDPSNSPLSAEQAAAFNQLLASLSPVQTAWLGGYLSGVAGFTQSLAGLLGTGQAAALPLAGLPAAGNGSLEATVLFGSQTGNCERVAKKLVAAAAAKGVQLTMTDMGKFRPAQLKKEKLLFVIVSTHGEGEPPDRVVELHKHLFSKRAPKLDELEFGVLALGDRTYRHYCKMGKDFDGQLEALGGRRVLDRVDCDVDFDEAAGAWIESVVELVSQRSGSTGGAAVAGFPAVTAGASQYDRKNPFLAPMLDRMLLTDDGSAKGTYHVELSLEDSGIQFLPGDALGVYPVNHPELVELVLKTAKLDGTTAIEEATLRERLARGYEVAHLTPDVVEKYAAAGEVSELKALLAEDRFDDLQKYMWGRDLVDLLEDYPVELDPAALLGVLRKLQPRLYSLANSLEACPEEAHLCIAPVKYEIRGRQRFGVASTWFLNQVVEETQVPVYVHENNYFRLPENGETPIIMIGPGTGVAPFRAFLQHREALGQGGRNWLFFGEQHFDTDFLYQAEWLQFVESGLLTRMDVAFSRDQAQKVYVQHRIAEQAAELWAWLQDGAHLYVCGDEARMAHDVQQALIDLVAAQGGKSPDEADAYLKELQRDGRYQRDVY